MTYLDPAGVGFFDQSTPQFNAPGNSGTTLGEQRRIAFEAALTSWTPALASSVPIRISAEFLDFGCSGFAATIHSFGPYQSQDGITGDLVKADPLLACTPISNDVSGGVVLIQRGSCPFLDKQDNATAAGALAIVMVDSLEPDHPNAIVNHVQVGGLAFPGIPFWTVTRPDGQPLLDAASLPQVTLRFDPDGELLVVLQHDNYGFSVPVAFRCKARRAGNGHPHCQAPEHGQRLRSQAFFRYAKAVMRLRLPCSGAPQERPKGWPVNVQGGVPALVKGYGHSLRAAPCPER